ncbi:MAG TPA: c-type cytochrome [Pirellulaceae bacterium]|jgi:cytochrome c553|nr:c-type cytochrome [Pirellulaceae bacterium]
MIDFLRSLPLARSIVRSLSLALALAGLALAASSALGEGPAVPGVERFYEAPANLSDEAKADGGDLLVQELNCVACHKAEGEFAAGLNVRTAPNLDAVGARVRPEWLREYLGAPHATKPGAVMPDMFAGVDEATKKNEVEALTHFLASKGTLAHGSPTPSGIARGEQIFHRVGCVACHDPMSPEKTLAHSAPLPHPLSAKYTVSSLNEFLKNPHGARPSGRMPSLNLNDAEASDLASYLLRDMKAASNLTAEIYKGSFSTLAQLRAAKPEATVPAFGFSIDLAGQKDAFGLRFDGQIKITKGGKYEFILASDDGSALWIDGKEVIAIDGVHPKSQKRASVDLKEGLHAITVEYYEQAGEEALEVRVKGPGLTETDLEALLYVEETKPEPGEKPEFVLDQNLVARGAEVFVKRNCVACHSAKDAAGKDLASSVSAKKLFDLSPQGGCLALHPAAGLPDYDLRPAQRDLLTAALKTAKARAETKPQGEEAVHRKFVALNCYACHQRGKEGGVETARLEYFMTDQPEMGDEGRVPPLLTRTGDKLKPEWLKEVLEKGSKERPYMMTRMPRFGSAALGDLAGQLTALDQQNLLTEPEIDLQAGQITSIGRHLVGGKALSCIKCHTFADKKATGIQAISLTTMHKRLRRDWFERYVLDPQKYRPGTRMPAPWPNGQSFYPDVLDGDTRQQIQAVWQYLSYGPSASVPLGLEEDAIELVAAKRPVIYRNFIEGAGVRAIGVGYPEHANLAFDADSLGIRLLWQNAFIDASKHWTNRGVGFQGPLGDSILKFETGVPATSLEGDNAAWPKETAKDLGWSFQGYRLNKSGQPTFLYSGPSVTVADFPEPVKEGQFPSLRRTIDVENSGQQALTYRPLRASKIEPLSDGTYRIDDAWTLAVESPAKPTVRDSEGQKELLIPLASGKSKIVLHYQW